MAKQYRVTGSVRMINRLMKNLVRLGIGPARMHILAVRGRKTGKTYKTPVSVIKQDGERWLVAPYGDVGWVRNARAAGEVSLQRGGQTETVGIEEVGPEISAPILKTYVGLEAITRPYFDAAPDAPVEAFAAEASRHPVFRIVPR